MYVLGNDKAENEQPPEAANVPLRSLGEQTVTEPPSTDKSVEMSESVRVSPPQADNQLPPEELRLFKLSLEATSNLQTSKLSGISEKQHLRILEEAFCGSEPHVLHHHVLCAKKSCKSLSSHEISRQLPSKPHVFKHDWIDDHNVFCCKSSVWWLAFKEAEGMFCCLCKKHIKTGKKVKYATAPGTRYRKAPISEHGNSEEHKQSVRLELLQRASWLQKDIERKAEVVDEVLVQAFAAFYFIAKEEISDMKVLPLIEFLTRFGMKDMQYFTHRSERSRQEIFLAIGAVIKSQVVKAAENGRYFSLLCDEVSDIAVTEQLVIFIQFVSDGHVHTRFLFIQNLLEHHKSANADAIVDMITQEIEKNNLKLTSLAGLASDGASVFTGSKNGVGVKLKKKQEEHMKEGSAGVMQQLWCVCHRLALACLGANDCVKYISVVETNLRQLWSLFENSNKKTALYAKAQMTIASLHLNENTKKAVVRKIQKAGRTRWLSLGKAVKSLYWDYPAVLATLRVLDDEYHDAAAKGLFMRLNTFKFIAVIYILNQIIPILDTVSKTFQKGTITFSHIGPNLAYVKMKLQEEALSHKAVTDAVKDLKPNGRLTLQGLEEVQVTRQGMVEMDNLLHK